MTEVVYTAEFEGSSSKSFSAVYPTLRADYFYQQDVFSAEFCLSTGTEQGGVLSFVLKNPRGDETYKLEITSTYHKQAVVVNQAVYVDDKWPDSYIVKCTVTFYSTMLINSRLNPLMDSHISRLTKDPENVMTFKCGEQEFKVVISIISSLSPVIDAMMKSKCIESETKTAEIKDFAPSVIQKMIEFCETTQITNVTGDELKLCEIAEKYNMDSLKKYAAAFAVKTMAKENVLKLFHFAQNHNNPYLMDYCVRRGVTDLNAVIKYTDYEILDGDSVKDFFAAIKQKM